MTKEIVDAMAIKRSLTRITYEIIEKNKGIDDLVIVGIKRRGVFIGKKIAKRLEKLGNVDIQFCELDISCYRDDRINQDKIKTNININIDNKRVILVDDVLSTGRTIRAALDALIDNGRPSIINLAVLVDRGNREFPIRADFVGKNIPNSISEYIKVNVNETEGYDSIEIRDIKLK